MLACFLLISHAPRWAPFVAIPLVLAASLASLCLVISGIRGLLVPHHRVRATKSNRALPDPVFTRLLDRDHHL